MRHVDIPSANLSTDGQTLILQTNHVLVLQTHVDNSFGNSLAFTMNNTYGTPSAIFVGADCTDK